MHNIQYIPPKTVILINKLKNKEFVNCINIMAFFEIKNDAALTKNGFIITFLNSKLTFAMRFEMTAF